MGGSTVNVAEILKTHVAARPSAPAIIDTYRGRPRCLTFAELDRAAGQAAALLERAGLRPGDAVLVFQPMSAELYVALLAIFRLGLVAMFLDPGQGRAHLEACCQLYPPKALLAGPKAHLLRLVSPALRRIPVKFAIGLRVPGAIAWEEAGRLSPTPAIWPGAPETPALLTFTSGSTGQPRAAQRSHGFLLAQERALTQSLGLAAGQVDLATMPIVTLANLAVGATSLIPDVDLRYPGAADPARLVAAVETYRVGRVVASPALLEGLARYCLRRGLKLPGLAQVFTGGAPVFPHLLDQLQTVAPRAEIVAVYGSTEAEPMAKVAAAAIGADERRAMLAGQGLLAGQPVEAIRLRILPDRWGQPLGPYTAAEFAALNCPPGQPGEIVVSGEHVLGGYLHGQGDRETKFRVEAVTWHRTGDAGYLDDEGRLWLLGRCAARIEDERGELYPFTIECAATQHPAIRRSAVIAREGRRLLAIECYDDLPRPDLTVLKQSLAWSSIDDIRLLKQIPVDRRHNAKVDYPALNKWVAGQK